MFLLVGGCSCDNVTIKEYGPLCRKKYWDVTWKNRKPICWVKEPSTCKDVKYKYSVGRTRKRFSAEACTGKLI